MITVTTSDLLSLQIQGYWSYTWIYWSMAPHLGRTAWVLATVAHKSSVSGSSPSPQPMHTMTGTVLSRGVDKKSRDKAIKRVLEKISHGTVCNKSP